MRHTFSGIVALIVLSMGSVASAHKYHGHVGKVWVGGHESPKCRVLSKVLHGGFVTYLGGPIDCLPREGFVGCGRCFPNCYLGTPCNCCVHKLHYTIPGTKFGRLLKEEALAGRAMQVEPPGMLARIRGETNLSPVR